MKNIDVNVILTFCSYKEYGSQEIFDVTLSYEKGDKSARDLLEQSGFFDLLVEICEECGRLPTELVKISTAANWTKNGSLVSLNPSYQIESLTSNSLYVANFNANPLSQISLTVSSNPISGGTATGGGTYQVGTSVTIKASPFLGHRFVNWTDQYSQNIISSSSSYTFVLNTNKSLVANYSIDQYTITTTAVNGSITKNPDQLNFNHGTNLQLTAVPKEGYSFTSWSGDTIAISNPLSIKMLSNKKITANFTAIPPATYTINITSNNGTVTKSPNQPSYISGTNVQLTASPITGYLFSSWSGDTIATSNPIQIGMTKNKNFTANFTIIPIVTYTLNTIGINGAITLSPNQLNYNSAKNYLVGSIEKVSKEQQDIKKVLEEIKS
jgi:uncharacterized repeat protein (TIGR02543 family)